MKKDLKSLMNKNSHAQVAKISKESDVVSHVLKNIERNCKALKKIH